MTTALTRYSRVAGSGSWRLSLFLLACGNGHTLPPSSLTSGGAAGAGGMPDPPESGLADPNVTRAQSWEACGRIPATPRAPKRPVHFGLDGVPVLGYEAVAGNAGVSASFGTDGKILLKVWPGDACATLAFSRDGTRLQASDGALDATQLPSLNGSLPPNARRHPFDDIVDSPDGVDTIVSSGCVQAFDELGETHACVTKLRSPRFAYGLLADLTAPFPAFSPDAHWVVAGPRLRHLPSGESRELDPKARVSIFAPNGDIIIGERDGSLARYCRRP